MIDSDAKLAGLLPQLKAATWIALDTEADSLHAYPEKLCLIQISIAGSDELIDPLASIQLNPLFDILSQHEILMHGADYDLRLFRKHHNFVPTAIFDTMLAARLLGLREFGLSNLVEKLLGAKLEKGPQKANWARRPLTPRMAEYAVKDTLYLKPLVDLLVADLKAKGRLAWHQQSCARLIADSAGAREVDHDTVWRVKGSFGLPPQGLAVVRALFYWREQEAVASNRPPFFIVSPDIICNVAGAAISGRDVESTLPRFLTPRRRKGALQAVHEGLASKDLPGPLKRRGDRLSETAKKRLNALEQRRNTRAHELGIDPTLIASRSTLIELSKDWDAVSPDLMPWQREILE